MKIFDGTIRPDLALTIDGSAISADDILEFTYKRGRERWDDALVPGKLTVVLNNALGTYSGIAANAVVEFGMDTENLFYGFIKESATIGNINPVVRVEAWDAAWRLGQSIVTESYLNAYPQEMTDDRANRIYTDYPSGLTGYSSGTSTGTTTMISTFGNMTALEALEQCRDTEVGPLYIDREGGLYFANNEDKTTRTTALVFSDTSNGTDSKIPYFNAIITPAAAYLVNNCSAERIERVGSATGVITAEYTSSVTSFGVKARKWQTYCYTDQSLRATAQYVAKNWASGNDTVSKIEFYGVDFDRNGAGYASLETLDIGDKITVTRDGTTYTCLVEGIGQSATGSSWIVRLWLSPYNSYTEDIAAGTTAPQTGFTFIEGAATRLTNSFDVKFEDFSDRGAASGGTTTPLVLWANRKQIAVYDSNSTGAYQFNIRGGYVDGTSTNDLKVSEVMLEDQCVTFRILVKCNNSAHYANSNIKIDGSTTNVTTIWLGGAPSAGTSGGWDEYTITVYLVNPSTSPATYRVTASAIGSS